MKKEVKFPTLAVILLVFAIIWLLSDFGIISVTLPWLPIILIVVAIGMIYNRFRKK
ncbi:MAG: hypothetical protein WC533_04065 [Candidatus Pacearchaeota archaeon]